MIHPSARRWRLRPASSASLLMLMNSHSWVSAHSQPRSQGTVPHGWVPHTFAILRFKVNAQHGSHELPRGRHCGCL